MHEELSVDEHVEASHGESHEGSHTESGGHGESAVPDMRIEAIQHRKHDRIMHRTLRWPVHGNSHRTLF